MCVCVCVCLWYSVYVRICIFLILNIIFVNELQSVVYLCDIDRPFLSIFLPKVHAPYEGEVLQKMPVLFAFYIYNIYIYIYIYIN